MFLILGLTVGKYFMKIHSAMEQLEKLGRLIPSLKDCLIVFIICNGIAGVWLRSRSKRKNKQFVDNAHQVRMPEKSDISGDNPSRIVAADFTVADKEHYKQPAVPLKPRMLVRGTAPVPKPDSSSFIIDVDAPTVILYSTLTGSSEKYAKKLEEVLLKTMRNTVKLLNIDYVDDFDDYFVKPKESLRGSLVLLVLPSYETECPLDFVIELLQETYNDFRIDSAPLRKLGGFSVFGIGDSEGWPEEKKYCYQARKVDKLLGRLGARRIFPLGTGCIKTDIDASFHEYVDHLINEIKNPSDLPELSHEDLYDSVDESEAEDVDVDEEESQRASGLSLIDVEDMGRSVPARTQALKPTKTSKEMVAKDSPTYKALTKQGYTIVGSHSGVKICRWTKSALRGRGSCYKFAFYGVRSHLCMETTPSLSCSNKCVFCWRHGTNPVGTTWRWQVDPPRAILDGALSGHYQKIKMMRGVPGIQASRFAEAFAVRHCALSLVGEPIFYPYINEFLEMLHDKHISSFLVCNAQHPAELAALKRVTQLYVSIDASDKESLRKVDRPLHRDFWERFERCLDIIRSRTEQRTVYRLTLVKGFNADDIVGYADMIERGQPCFIEIKGVTFCGTSSSYQLRMSNVPFYDEVVDFVVALKEELDLRGLEYGIATEHAHSLCILLAQERFKINDKWHTHIDYPKFFELLESGTEFGPMDYVAETPEWAYFGSEHHGFNPVDIRHRKGKPI